MKKEEGSSKKERTILVNDGEIELSNSVSVELLEEEKKLEFNRENFQELCIEKERLNSCHSNQKSFRDRDKSSNGTPGFPRCRLSKDNKHMVSIL